MRIADRAVLVTGANRGIGQALVEEVLWRGAKRFYASTRQPSAHPDRRIAPRTFDVTNAAQTQAAVESVESLDILVNNAGVFLLSLRALLAGRGVRVHAVLTGPVDTDMNRGLDIPKASPDSVARAIFDGAEKGEEDIFPDPMSESLAESWRIGAGKGLERQNEAFVQAEPVTSWA